MDEKAIFSWKTYLDDTSLKLGLCSPATRDDGSQWPKITIITPSFNQGNFLEEAIRSVLLQGYPNLEFFIIDGGSNDNSVNIIKKYASYVTWWVSEKDRGQTHAILKGFSRSTGDVIAWLNSDDYYLPGTLFAVAKAMRNQDWVHGKSLILDQNDGSFEVVSEKRKPNALVDQTFKNGASLNFTVAQPSHFWSRKMIDEIGFVNESYHYCMDREFFFRALCAGYKPHLISDTLAVLRYHPDTKTMQKQWAFEFEKARIYKSLAFKGYLRLRPASSLYRSHSFLGHRLLSEEQFRQRRYVRSMNNEVLSFIFSQDKSFRKFKTRISTRMSYIIKRKID